MKWYLVVWGSLALLSIGLVIGVELRPYILTPPPPPDVSGHWSGQIQMGSQVPGGEPSSGPAEVILVQNGKGLTGNLRWRQKSGTVDVVISSGVIDGNQDVSLMAKAGGMLATLPMTFDGTIEGNILRGTISLAFPANPFSRSSTSTTLTARLIARIS